MNHMKSLKHSRTCIQIMNMFQERKSMFIMSKTRRNMTGKEA